jgi:triosephosphate isomerase
MDKEHRKAIIAGNWKMNKLASEVPAFVQELLERWQPDQQVELALCVPFPLIPAMNQAVAGTAIRVGAQDVSVHEAGAYPGEVSAAMLADLPVTYGIVGHSERRAYHGETDEIVNGKLHALLGAGISPILCVGESLEKRDDGKALDFVAGQVQAGLAGVTPAQMERVVIAYEPIWAIGTGRTATDQQAQEVCGHIRKTIEALYGESLAQKVSILYGGSMNENNAAGLLAQPDIDGGLIGGASLKPAAFAAIGEKAGGHG